MCWPRLGIWKGVLGPSLLLLPASRKDCLVGEPEAHCDLKVTSRTVKQKERSRLWQCHASNRLPILDLMSFERKLFVLKPTQILADQTTWYPFLLLTEKLPNRYTILFDWPKDNFILVVNNFFKNQAEVTKAWRHPGDRKLPRNGHMTRSRPMTL